jgi:hypothetical protein
LVIRWTLFGHQIIIMGKCFRQAGFGLACLLRLGLACSGLSPFGSSPACARHPSQFVYNDASASPSTRFGTKPLRKIRLRRNLLSPRDTFSVRLKIRRTLKLFSLRYRDSRGEKSVSLFCASLVSACPAFGSPVPASSRGSAP